MKFRKLDGDVVCSIEAEDLTTLKAALLTEYGFDVALLLFQKKIEDSITLYCPTDGERNNLVKRNFNSYVSENREEINLAIKSIKEL